MKGTLNNSLNKLGNNFIIVEKWPWAFNDPNYAWWKYWNRPVPDMDELKLIQNNVPSCRIATLSISSNNQTIKFRNSEISNINAIAVSREYPLMNDLSFEYGRFISPPEDQNGVPCIVLGYNVAMQLNNDNPNLIGQDVDLFNRKMNVIGVLKKEGNKLFGDSHDDMILISYNFYKTVCDIHDLDLDAKIKVDAKEGASVATLKNELTRVLRAHRKLRPKQEDNFALNQMSVLRKGFDGIFASLNIGGFFIGLLSLIVGTFGIANILFVSVRERTPQIGIKKALGARNFFILLEFLIESVVLCVLGGVIGILLVFILLLVAEKVFDLTLYLSLAHVFFGVSISVIIGIIAGFVPALVASKMHPVDAIRFR
jgi:putative ABC transport system permease protein